MCWICNPMCGKCQPAPMKSATCEECGTVTVYERAKVQSGERLLCKKCGHDQTEAVVPKVTRCNHSGLLCAYPCGRSTSSIKHEHGYQRCERNTPPSEEWLAAHPTAARLASELP